MFNNLFEELILRVYKIKFIGLMFFVLVDPLHAEVPFSYTSYKVNDLYNDALKYIDDKDYEKAIEKLLICKTSKRCVSLLADIYKLDDPAVSDINKSAYYQEILFGLGVKKAYHNIGFLYYKNGDLKNAKKYFIKSSEAGVYQSLFNLGKIYELEKNFDKSLEVYREASSHNVSQADYSLALHYYKKKNINMALLYFNKAAKQGFEPAMDALKQLKSNLKNRRL